MKEKKYNFVYKTTNNINGDYYYGVHATDNLDDGYMGSGKRIAYAIKKYGKSNFTRTIIQYFSTIKEAYLLEAEIVTPELLKDPHCYNMCKGGGGGMSGLVPWNKGKKCPLSEEHKKKLSEKLKGRKFSDEHKTNLSLSRSGKHYPKLSEAQKGKSKSEEHVNKLRNRKRTPEQRKRISKGTKKAMQNPEVLEKISLKGERHPNYGKHWKVINGKRIYV